MVLTRKAERELVPQYSLTGDLLSFLRCRLQYRYHNGSALPPSRPVQLWFGEFIHGVLESAFRIWSSGNTAPLPWPCTPTPPRMQPPVGRVPHDIGSIGDIVEATLRAKGKNPRSNETRQSAYLRAERAVNELGPHLFPLISAVEERVIGTRQIPTLPADPGLARAAFYELHGIIDVLTNVQLGAAGENNAIRRAIESAGSWTGAYEVIVDYKGSRRPEVGSPYWQQHEWQIQTYAWLRMRQPNALPVAAGVLLYINELAPGQEDLATLKRALERGIVDVAPVAGSLDSYALHAWRPGNAIPTLSPDFRLARALRVIPVSAASQEGAAGQFDRVVEAIEGCVASEAASGRIIENWNPVGDPETCAACDFRHFCPSPQPRVDNYVPGAPLAP